MVKLNKSERFIPSIPASEMGQGKRRRNKNRLSDVKVLELSIVDSPAVKLSGGGNFFLFKRDDNVLPQAVSESFDEDSETCMFQGVDLLQEHRDPEDPEYKRWRNARSMAHRELQGVFSQIQKKEENEAIEMIVKIECALLQMKDEYPELYKELEKDPSAFDFEELENGFSISQKAHTWKNLPAGRKTDPRTGFGPGETMTHKFSFDNNRWEPKRARDSYGRYR